MVYLSESDQIEKWGHKEVSAHITTGRQPTDPVRRGHGVSSPENDGLHVLGNN